jgi:hypothetical protein
LFGFGGIPKLDTYTKDETDGCFPLNGNEEDPTVKGIVGIMNAYRNVVNKVELSEPTIVA